MRHDLRPLFDRVVIKELEPDRVRRSGLLVPPGSHEPPPHHGIVLAVGPGIDWWEAAGVRMPVGLGDHVVFPRARARGSTSTRSACWSAASPRSSGSSSARRTASPRPERGGRSARPQRGREALGGLVELVVGQREREPHPALAARAEALPRRDADARSAIQPLGGSRPSGSRHQA